MQACYLSNMAGKRERSFEMLNGLNRENRGQRAQILLLQIFLLALPFRNLERQTSSWERGCSATGLHPWSQEEGLPQVHKQLWVLESPAVWQLLSWIHLACHGGRGTKKVTGWDPLLQQGWHLFYPEGKADFNLGRHLHCEQQVSGHLRNKNSHLSACLGKSKSVMPTMQHSTEQAWSANSRRGCHVPKITQEIHGRTEISQVPNLERSLVFLPPCQ